MQIESGILSALPGSLGLCSRLNFDAGGLQWAAGNTADISTATVTMLAGGAKFDLGANAVTFASAIGSSSAGGLTKLGSGTLTLNGNNSYAGNTVVEVVFVVA